MTNEAKADDKRQAPRYSCTGEAEIVVPGRGLRYPGRIVDLSAGGCFIETICKLERGTSVEVWINMEFQPLRLAANLVVRRETGVGCRFHSVTARKLEQIQIVIHDLTETQRLRAAQAEAQRMAAEARAQGTLTSSVLEGALSTP